MESSGTVVFVFEGFRLDTMHRRLSDPDGHTLPVSGRAFDVLAYLVANRSRVVTKGELLDAVWSGVVVEENNLNQAIKNLRKALGDSREAPRFIRTVAGRGFQFVAFTRVESSEAQTGESGQAPARPVTPSLDVLTHGSGHLRSRRWMLLAGATAAIGIAGGMWSRHLDRAATKLPKSIAVLPFNSLLKGEANPAVELGITESLINQLGMIPGVVVLPLSTVRRFSGDASDPMLAGRELGVAAVLDGHVQTDQDRLRVTARLLETDSGRALWSGRFNESLDDFFLVQESLAKQLVSALELELSPAQQVRLARRDTLDREAWQLYLNGRYQFRLRTEDGLLKALEFYEAAAKRDPAFALPRAGIADVLSFQGVFGIRPPAAVFPRADYEAQLAAELDHELAEAYLSLGHVKVQYYRLVREGERLYRHSLSLRPEQARGRLLLANCLMTQGRVEESLAESQRSHAIEPADITFGANLGMLLTFARRFDEAYERLTGLFGTTPDSPLPRHHLARLQILRGEPRDAIRLLAGYAGRAPGAFSNLGRAYAHAGLRQEALAELARLDSLGAQGFGVAFDAALIHAALGATASALDALERGLTDHSQMMLFLNVEPGLDSLRDEPRFRAVADKLGLGGLAPDRTRVREPV